VTNNTVTDNIWSPCVSPAVCETNAAGILIYQSNGVFVANNALATNQIGVFNGGQNSTIVSNTISNSITLIGIALVGNENTAAFNFLSHADQAAVYIQGNNNGVTGNEITDASVGVLKISGSTGNTITGNRFFATLVRVQDPAAKRPIGVAPVR
jgi:nitrous oxidase accessory protein NosD